MKIPRLLEIRPNSLPQKRDRHNPVLENKVRELIEEIGFSAVDKHQAHLYQQQIADAFENSAVRQKKVAPFQELGQDNNLSREELLEGLEKLLAENPIDSKINTQQTHRNTLQKVIMFIMAIILITVGFSMIILPTPPSFEIFTIYYFNANDGVTIMDLISLLIIFGGVLMFVLNFSRK